MKKCGMYGAILAAALILTGCATTQRDWDTASQRNTIAVYESFIAEHPDAPQTSEARQRIAKLTMEDDWRAAKKQDTIRGYESFVAKYGQSQYAKTANDRLAKLYLQRDYDAAKKADSIEEFEAFLKKYASSPLAGDAKKRLDELYVNRDWQAAKTANTVEGYERFIALHPTASRINEAKANIDTLDWNALQSIGTVEALRSFEKKHPDSSHIKEARARLKELTMPALVNAAEQNDMKRLKLLLSKGENVNSKWEGITALMYASYNGNLDMVKLLVEKGAEINNMSGRESAIYLSDIGNYNENNKKAHPDIVDYLVSHALAHKGLRYPSVKEIRAMARKVVTEARMNFGGVGIELLTVSRSTADKNIIDVTGNVASWSGNSMYHIGVWQLFITRDKDKWKAFGMRVGQ